MWDCKYRRLDDFCTRRKAVCWPGGIACVLKGKFEFPLREEEGPLIRKRTRKEIKTTNLLILLLVCLNCHLAHAGGKIPESIIKRADDYIISQVGREYFENNYKEIGRAHV